MSVLCDDAFKVALAYQLEEMFALCLDVINVKQVVGISRHDPSQRSLAFDERQLAEIAAILPQDVEGAEVRCTAPEQELVKLRVAVLVQAGDFAIKYDGTAFYLFATTIGELLEAGEGVAIPRDQAHRAVLRVSQSAEAVMLDLEQPVGMGKGLRSPHQWQGLEGRYCHISV